MSALARSTAAHIAHHPDALAPGTRLGEFEVATLLGVGGFGMVYQAFDHSLLRFVAIKEYMPATLASRAEGGALEVRGQADEATFRAGLASFVDEARLLAQFDHPALVKVFRFWEANNTAYMVMPLYSGMTLKQARAHMRTPPPEEWLRKLLWSVTSGLRVLHEAGMLHRDISPDNIFLQDHGQPVLLDLGAARHAIHDRDAQQATALKINYAPLELYADTAGELKQGPWSDLYSLGAVVHGCLCNDTPLPATLRAMRDRMVPFSRVARTVRKQFGVEYSRPFVEAVAHCLQLQPHDRPHSIDAFLQELGMGAAPAGMDGFDFRAQLGSIWVEPADKDDQGVAVPMIDVTALSQPLADAQKALEIQRASLIAQPDDPPASVPAAQEPDEPPQPPVFQETVVQEAAVTDFADTRVLEPVAEPRPRRERKRASSHGGKEPQQAAGKPQRHGAASRPGHGMALAVLALALVLLAGLWWARRAAPTPPRTPDSEIIVEHAAPPAAPAPANAEPVAIEEQPAPEPAPPEPVAESAPPVHKDKPARRRAKPAVEPAPVAAPAPAPVSAPEPPRPMPVETPPEPQRKPGPEQACAAESFLTRPMCVFQQCQKPGMADNPVCVKNRRQREEQERQRQLYPQ